MFPWVELTELTGKAAGLDPVLADGDSLCEGVLAVERARAALDAAEGHMLAELDRQGFCSTEFGLSTGGWLAREAGLPAGVARQRVKVAAVLSTSLGEVDDALADGRIGFEHARVIVDAANPRVAEQVAAIQSELINAADGRVFEWWRREVLGIVDLLDQDGGHDPDTDLARNRLTVARTFDGITHLAGTLTGDDAVYAHEAIEAKADELFRRFAADQQTCPELHIPARATLRALAFIELCRQAQAVDIQTSRPPRPELTLIVDADLPDRITTLTGERLREPAARRLLCNPVLHPLVLDALGVPLDAGRETRLATRAQRRAAAVRDGGCVFPGCDRPITWTDLHHVVHWLDDGRTDLDNLASLCRFHHGITHRAGWTMHATVDQWFWWQTPNGRTFWSQRHGQQRAGPAPPPRTE